MAVVADDVVNGMTTRDLVALMIIIAAALAIGSACALWLRHRSSGRD